MINNKANIKGSNSIICIKKKKKKKNPIDLLTMELILGGKIDLENLY